VIRRLAAPFVACALLALGVSSAAAEVPAGPRLTFMRASGKKLQLISSDPAGADQQVLIDGRGSQPLPFTLSAPSWSADGARVVFVGRSGGRRRAIQYDIYMSAADGSGTTKIAGTREGFNSVLSRDGRLLAFTREAQTFQAVSVWLLELDTGTVRQLTPWRNNFFEYPSSFDPDGSALGISRTLHRDNGPDLNFAVALRVDGSGSTVLARNAGEPVYSPDGTKLALISTGRTKTVKIEGGTASFVETDLAVANADGSGLTRLTHTRPLELQPSWDPSGQRLLYTQIPSAGSETSFLGFGDSIMEINADGSCRTRILGSPKAALFGAVWQPGPGREAGPIAC
jgi:Tol biopolymer transport system component